MISDDVTVVFINVLVECYRLVLSESFLCNCEKYGYDGAFADLKLRSSITADTGLSSNFRSIISYFFEN